MRLTACTGLGPVAPIDVNDVLCPSVTMNTMGAALPWIAIGLLLAIFFAGSVDHRKNRENMRIMALRERLRAYTFGIGLKKEKD